MTVTGIETHELRTSSPEKAAASLTEVYGSHAWLHSDDPDSFQYRVISHHDEQTRFSTVHLKSRGTSGVESLDDFVIAWPASGEQSWRVGDETGTGPLPFVIPPHRELELSFDDLDLFTVSLSADAVAEAIGASGPDPLRALDRPNVLKTDAATLISALDHLMTLQERVPGAFDSRRMRESARELIIASALETFDLFAPQREARGDAAVTAQRAVDFIRDHLSEPLTTERVAEAAGVTPRALQYTFRRRLGASPLEYVRRLRLDAVRRDLLAQNAGGSSSVRAIAARWGFVHMSRFARFYEEQFGELPHATLQR